MKDTALRFLALGLALVFYLPLLTAAMLLCGGGKVPGIFQVRDFFRDLLEGKTFQECGRAWRELKREMVLSKTSSRGPNNPGFKGQGAEMAERDRP